MYAVGVGNAVEDELKEIASEPTAEHYFYTADFKTMTQIAKKLQINICPGQPAWLTTHTSNHPRDYSCFLNSSILFPQMRTLVNVTPL